MSSPSDRMSETPDMSTDYFDEISGRFRSLSSTDSEESFQIVFSDSPRISRMRRPSDCESEDSFIVFEDPDNCYTSTDVFGDSEYESESDSDVDFSNTKDVEAIKLSNTLSRTLSDLTDGSLYEDKALDEVDCAVSSMCVEIPPEEIVHVSVSVSVPDVKSTGLLLNNEKKLLKRNQPPKKVQFSTKPPKVHVMRVWAFAARQARAGHWERCALDRDRFKRRIADVDMAVSWVLKPQHRSRVMFQRFMPWWNAQKRKEQAEKKAREEELMKLQAEQEKNLINGNLDSAIDKEECDANFKVDENDTTDCRVDCKGDINNDPTVNVGDKLSFVQSSGTDNEGSKVVVKIKEPPDDHVVFQGAISNDLSMKDCNGIVKIDIVNNNAVNNEATSIIPDNKDSCNSHKSNTKSVSSINDMIKVNGVCKEICNTIEAKNSICQVSDTQIKPANDNLDLIKCNGIKKGIINSNMTVKDLSLINHGSTVIDAQLKQVNNEVNAAKHYIINKEFNKVATDLTAGPINDVSNNQFVSKNKTENVHQIKNINNKLNVMKCNGINIDLSKTLNVTETLQCQLTTNSSTDIPTLNDGKLDLFLIKDATVQFDKGSLNSSYITGGRIVPDNNKTIEQKSHVVHGIPSQELGRIIEYSSSNHTNGRIAPDNNKIAEQKSQVVNGIPPHELGRIIEYSLTNLELSFSSLSLY